MWDSAAMIQKFLMSDVTEVYVMIWTYVMTWNIIYVTLPKIEYKHSMLA